MLQSFLVYFITMFLMMLYGIMASKRAALLPNQAVPFFTSEVWLMLLTFALVFGMRYDVGIDYMNYLNSYRTGYDVERTEWLFRKFIVLLSHNRVHYAFYFGAIAFSQILFFLLAFKNERFLFPYLIFVLFAGQYCFLWMNVMRQDIAACIFIYAVRYIDEKKFWRYLLWCVIAFLIHKTAIILVLLYPLLKSGRDYFKRGDIQLLILFIFIILHFSSFNLNLVLSPLIRFVAELLNYDKIYIERLFAELQLSEVSIKRNTGIGFILLALVDVIVVLYSTKLKSFFNTKRFTIMYNLYFAGTIIQIFLAEFMILSRPFRYFRYFKLIVVAYLLYYLYNNTKTNNTVVLLILIVLYLMIFASAIFLDSGNKVLFTFFWQH